MNRLIIVGVIAGLGASGCGRREDKAADARPVPVIPAEGLDKIWEGRGVSSLEWREILERLDDSARLGHGVSAAEAELLLGQLAGGAPQGISLGSWRHLFNSALNALAATDGVTPDQLAAPLLRVLGTEEDRALRLFALQHLGVHQPRLSEPLRSEVGQRMRELAEDEDSDISGTAMIILGQWSGALGVGVPELTPQQHEAMIVRTLSNRNRPVDIRTSAAHAAVDGRYPEALPAARAIAADPSEAVVLRKSVIHLLGRLGGSEDMAVLEQCAAESPRLAQAAEPALAALGRRLAGEPDPNLIPYR